SSDLAENGAVYDYRPMFRIVGANVFEIEILGLPVIELDRCALPVAPNCVCYIEIDFGPVKCTVLLVDCVNHLRAVECSFELRFGPIPGRYFPERIIGPRRQFRGKLQTEIAVDPLHEPN